MLIYLLATSDAEHLRGRQNNDRRLKSIKFDMHTHRKKNCMGKEDQKKKIIFDIFDYSYTFEGFFVLFFFFFLHKIPMISFEVLFFQSCQSFATIPR